jgi:isoamylase
VPTQPSRPHPLGVHPRDGGVDVAVLAAHADRVELCLFDPAPAGTGTQRRNERRNERRVERRVELTGFTHGVWHDHVPHVPVGTRYGLRVHGGWDPVRGLRHNPAKLLLDPYARAIDLPTSGASPGRRLTLVPELFGHVVDDDLRGDPGVRDDRYSAGVAPLGLVTAPGGSQATHPYVPWSDTVIYETHLRGLTRRMPGIPQALRGTYAGLGHPATIQYLLDLGVTTVELLPVQAIADEEQLARRKRPNYWGYSTLGFFAPDPYYAAADDPSAVVAEFRDMVAALHGAGLELVLDVVYNHTCEGGLTGPTLSWRGLDAATYYRLDGQGGHIDTTGCGNSLNFAEPRVLQLTLDSLRYWVGELGVDGFRFDLAPTLARGRDGFDPDHPILIAMRTDPVLAGAKLIAEPWDLGPHGWRTGQFPVPFAEWNDRFRDSVRDFWLIDAARAAHHEPSGGVRDLATRLAGSADMFTALRGPLASVNFVTAHDGFTLADCATYNGKHNEDNGEDNRDGTDNNHSWNHGVEGPTDDEAVAADRRRSVRNILGTLLIAAGVPMLLAGDESGRTQGGNNNAYCLDDETAWLDWDLDQSRTDLLDTVRHLVAIRRDHPVLRQELFFAGRPVHPDGTKDLAWFAADGSEMNHDRWHDPGQRVLQMYLHAVVPGPDGRHLDGSLLVVVQGSAEPVEVRLPGRSWAHQLELLWDSACDRPPTTQGPTAATDLPGAVVTVPADSLRIYRVPSRAATPR